MTTLKAQMAADNAAVFQNTDEFAETWEHWPQGNQVLAASVVVVPDFPMTGGEGTERNRSEGDEQIIKFTIYVPDSLENLGAESTWRDTNEKDYATISLGESQAGLRPIVIQRNDKDHTRRHSAGRLL